MVSQLTFNSLNAALKAAGEATRLRAPVHEPEIQGMSRLRDAASQEKLLTLTLVRSE